MAVKHEAMWANVITASDGRLTSAVMTASYVELELGF
jgi:hypothetical protein